MLRALLPHRGAALRLPLRLRTPMASSTRRFASSGETTDDSAVAPSLPEHHKFRMPDLDVEVQDDALLFVGNVWKEISGGSSGVTLSKWKIQEGQQIVDGTHMCEIDTPDVTFVLDSGDEGYLARILVPTGTENVPPGQPLAIIVPSEADIEPFIAALKEQPTAIRGYVEPTSDAASSSSGEDETSGNAAGAEVKSSEADAEAEASSRSTEDSGADVLRQLHDLDKEGKFPDDRVFKKLKSLARKNDTQLLVTYRGSFGSDGQFDATFFVETACELAEEALNDESIDQK